MDDDLLPGPRAAAAGSGGAPGLPRPLAGLSIDDLERYVAELRGEIARVEAEIGRRRDLRGAADALFKPRGPAAAPPPAGD